MWQGSRIAQSVVCWLAVLCDTVSPVGPSPELSGRGDFPSDTWVPAPFPKTLSDESINPGLVCAHIQFIADLSSSHSRPRPVNASNKNTPSRHHPQRRNVTTSMAGLKNCQIGKNLTHNGEPQIFSRERRSRRRMWLAVMGQVTDAGWLLYVPATSNAYLYHRAAQAVVLYVPATSNAYLYHRAAQAVVLYVPATSNAYLYHRAAQAVVLYVPATSNAYL